MNLFATSALEEYSQQKRCQNLTKLIVFLGTPHRGSQYADWGQIASKLARLTLQDPNEKLLQGLEVNSEVLDNIDEQFMSIAVSANIGIHSFQEARGVTGVRGLSGRVSGMQRVLDIVNAAVALNNL
ncbi:MAG: hypothetical protein Q9162_007966 [Coniocarpon cinnabarinum]